jgi:hypothetical protein
MKSLDEWKDVCKGLLIFNLIIKLFLDQKKNKQKTTTKHAIKLLFKHFDYLSIGCQLNINTKPFV